MARMATYWLAVLLRRRVQMRAELTSWMPDSVGAGISGMTVPLVGLPFSPGADRRRGDLRPRPALPEQDAGEAEERRPAHRDRVRAPQGDLADARRDRTIHRRDGRRDLPQGFMAGADYVLGEVFGRIIMGAPERLTERVHGVQVVLHPLPVGPEKRIRDNALHRIKVAGVEDVIPQVVMPFKIVTDMKRGKKRTVEEKLYPHHGPGDLENPEDAQVIARTILRGIDGLRDFLGAPGEPTRSPRRRSPRSSR